MKIKSILLALLACLTLVFAAGCDGNDGKTESNAESNGVISDTTTNRPENSDRDDISNRDDDTIGDDIQDGISDVISGTDDAIDDIVSGTESVVSDMTDDKK